MVNPRKSTHTELIDLSIMPTLYCNLTCPFCMYEAGPSKGMALDINALSRFLGTVDYTMINAVGFFGGEISCRMKQYAEYMKLIPKRVTKFTITNGAWSTGGSEWVKEFVRFIKHHKMLCFISRNPHQKKFQDQNLIFELLVREPEYFFLKHGDTMLPMGRAKGMDHECIKSCREYKVPMRLTVKPNGKILFGNCDGVYPEVGFLGQPFSKVVQSAREVPSKCIRSCSRALVVADKTVEIIKPELEEKATKTTEEIGQELKERNLLKKLFTQYRELLDSIKVEPQRLFMFEFNQRHKEISATKILAHVSWACEEAQKLMEQDDCDYCKISRWLGFIQGVLWSHDFLSLTETVDNIIIAKREIEKAEAEAQTVS
jgi:hypothetical protein